MEGIMTDNVALYYERLVCSAYNCKKSQYAFATKEYCLQAKVRHPKALAAFLLSALIIMEMRNPKYEETINGYIQTLDDHLTYRNAKNILFDMEKSGINLK